MSETTLTPEQQAVWRQVVAKAWADPAFKSKLLADPAGALVGIGVELPDGLALHVHEAMPTTMHLVLPPRPADELDDEVLQGVAGGTGPTPRLPGQHAGHPATQQQPTTWTAEYDALLARGESPTQAAINATNAETTAREASAGQSPSAHQLHSSDAPR